MSALRHPLGRARGLGSARSGLHHWVVQRATSVLLVFLVPWALYAVMSLAGTGHEEARTFIARPWNATLAVLFVATLLYHAALGLQVVIEDYVHQRALELTLHFLVRALSLAGAVLGIIYVLDITLGS